MNRGIYRDDLAEVEHCDIAQNMITIKLISRIDYAKKRGGDSRGTSNDQNDIVPEPHQSFKEKNRLAFKKSPARLFDETAVEYNGWYYDGDSIGILPKHKALKDETPFKGNELRKYFSVENHVKVLNGRFECEMGMIVGIKDEMPVRTSDLQNL